MNLTKLPFATHAELIEAFKSGAKFQIVFYPGTRKPLDVIDIGPAAFGRANVRVDTSGSSWTCFHADGTNWMERGAFLVMTKAAEATPAPAVTVPSANVIDAFTRGKDLHCPKTKEAVIAISYGAGGSTRVTLRSADGVERVSTNFRADGTHRHVSDRDLKVGRPPKKVVLRVYKDPRNWNDDAYFVLSPIQVLPNLTAFAGLKPIATVEIDG